MLGSPFPMSVVTWATVQCGSGAPASRQRSLPLRHWLLPPPQPPEGHSQPGSSRSPRILPHPAATSVAAPVWTAALCAWRGAGRRACGLPSATASRGSAAGSVTCGDSPDVSSVRPAVPGATTGPASVFAFVWVVQTSSYIYYIGENRAFAIWIEDRDGVACGCYVAAMQGERSLWSRGATMYVCPIEQ